MHTNTTHIAPGDVDCEELDRHIAELYRDVAEDEPRPAPPRGPVGEAVGYPPLCAHGMNSSTDRGYGLALARLRRG